MSGKKDFANLKFRVECSRMVLTKAGGAPLVVHGPGEIWQNENGVLQFKIFADQAGYRRLKDYSWLPAKIGQLIPAENCFSLEAQFYSDLRWKAGSVFPFTRGGPDGGLAYGSLHELIRLEPRMPNPKADYVTLRFRGELKFPLNQGTEAAVRIGGQDCDMSRSLHAAVIEDDELRFEVYHDPEGEHTVVSLALPEGRLTTATPDRIREALQFVLGQQLALMVVETDIGEHHMTRLTSPSWGGGGEMGPPLRFYYLVHDGRDVWRMFTNYFRHVHLYLAASRHPISRHLHNVIEATTGSLGGQILALVVAVEGLAGDCFSGLAPVSSDFLAALDAVQATFPAIRTAQAGGEIDGLALNDRTLGRLRGSLNSMRKPRNSDILRAFISKSGLPDDLYKSWSRLRNSSAHGGGAGGRGIETNVRLKDEVLSLLYAIVFSAIGYAGPRTDYSLTEWPTRVWPIPSPSAAASGVPAPAPACPPSGEQPQPPPARLTQQPS